MNVEIDLITACLRKERKAEYELYRKAYPYLMSVCYRYVNSHEEAREMLNIGFLKILDNLDKYKPEIPFKSWARMVMINLLIDEYRKEKKHHERVQYIEEYGEPEDHAEANQAMVKMDVEEIHAMINQLPPTGQKVFNLYVIDGY